MLNLQHIFFECVDNFCLSHHVLTGEFSSVIHVNMSMHKILRMVFLKQIIKNIEALVAEILIIVKSPGGGMRDKNIKALAFPKLIAELLYSLTHLLIGILIHTRLITVRSTQSQYPDSVELINMILDTDTALRRGPVVFVIMVSVHIKHRNGHHRRQK